MLTDVDQFIIDVQPSLIHVSHISHFNVVIVGDLTDSGGYVCTALVAAGVCLLSSSSAAPQPQVTWSTQLSVTTATVTTATTPARTSQTAPLHLVNVTGSRLLRTTSSAPAEIAVTSPPYDDDVTSTTSPRDDDVTASRDPTADLRNSLDLRESSVAVAAATLTASTVSASSVAESVVASNTRTSAGDESTSVRTTVAATVAATSSSARSGSPSSPSVHDVSSPSPSSVAVPAVDVTTAAAGRGEYFEAAAARWVGELLVLVLCLLALVALCIILLVCLLRARSRHKLCWTKHRCYLPVPLFYQNGTRAAAAVVLDPSCIPAGTAVTIAGNGAGTAPEKGPELAPLTYV